MYSRAVRRLLLALVLVLVSPSAASAAQASLTLEINSIETNTPFRGQATATVTVTAKDRCEVDGQLVNDTSGICRSATISLHVLPPGQPCTQERPGNGYFAPFVMADGAVTSRTQIVPYHEGVNKFCVVATGWGPEKIQTSLDFVAPDVYPTQDDKNCPDFASQRAAQETFNRWRPRDPYGLDGDRDGIACEDNRAPFFYGAEYPLPAQVDVAPVPSPSPVATPAPTVPAPSTSAACKSPKAVQRLVFSKRRYPNIRRHMQSAVRNGWPRTMVLNRTGADQRRTRLLRGLKTRKGMDRDEYPAAVGRGVGQGLTKGARPTGWRADVRYVPSKENRSHGAALGAKLRGLCDGTRFRYEFR